MGAMLNVGGCLLRHVCMYIGFSSMGSCISRLCGSWIVIEVLRLGTEGDISLLTVCCMCIRR